MIVGGENMRKMGIVIAVIVGVILLIVVACVGSYNGLVGLSEDVDNEFSNVSVMLERRADLIPNLVNTVKGYASHEEKVIEEVTSARSELLKAKTVEEKANANSALDDAINKVLMLVENYPDLKANQNFINLQDELAGSENRIATARRDYNNKVKEYNSKIKKIPTNIIAGIAGFDEKEYFEIEEGKKEVPDVNFE